MKTILIPINSNFFARNFLRTDAFKILKARQDLRVVLLVPPSKLSYYRKEFGSQQVIVDNLALTRDSAVENFFRFLERNSIVTNRVKMDQITALYKRKKEPVLKATIRFLLRLVNFLAARALYYFGHLGMSWRFLVRWLYSLVPTHYYVQVFAAYKPDLIFCPTLVWHEDYCLIREARKSGVKTAGMIFSWDSFYSKTFFLAYPGHLFVQTPEIANQAKQLANYPYEIDVVGFPQYDSHFQKRGIIPRAEFLKQFGADPAKKLILYAFSGKAGLDIEFDVLDIMAKAIRSGEIKGAPEVLIRPYPRFDFSEAKLSDLKRRYGFRAAASTSNIGADSSADWEMDDRAISLLVNSLAHADLIITMYSTFFIEGAIFNKPLIAVGFDGFKTRPYPLSAKRFFNWDHLKDLKAQGGISIVSSAEEFIAAINRSLAEPAYLAAGRGRIVSEHCYFKDGMSGKRLAEALIKALPEQQ